MREEYSDRKLFLGMALRPQNSARPSSATSAMIRTQLERCARGSCRRGLCALAGGKFVRAEDEVIDICDGLSVGSDPNGTLLIEREPGSLAPCASASPSRRTRSGLNRNSPPVAQGARNAAERHRGDLPEFFSTYSVYEISQARDTARGMRPASSRSDVRPPPRAPRGQPGALAHSYPLGEVLLLVTCAMIASCDDFDDLVAWGKHHLHFLRQFSEFHHGIPCERWLRNLMNRIDPALFGRCFKSWVASLWERHDCIAHRRQNGAPNP
jgi:DDE_Tnp_1-associated